jgi:flavin reductase (DIM6/NTAB) family NADH-FMN oxidoreductase RutF
MRCEENDMQTSSVAAGSGIDPSEFRRALGTFVTGVTVITTRDAEGRPRGMTANSFTSVSLDPALVLVCIGKAAASYSVFQETDCFAVNVLHEGQTDVSNLFASKSPDKFTAVDALAVRTGAPVLKECLTWFDCKVHHRMEAGDHAILIGQVEAFGTTSASPLSFCRGRYAQVKDSLPPGWLSSHDMIIGYLVEAQDRLLLAEDGKGGWVLPTAAGRILDGHLRLAGGGTLKLEPKEAFLYSVFDMAGSAPGYMVYRAKLAQRPADLDLPAQFRLFPLHEIPFGEIASREIRSMLKRYLHERATGRYGIYMDSPDGGNVTMVGETRPWVQLSHA